VLGEGGSAQIRARFFSGKLDLLFVCSSVLLFVRSRSFKFRCAFFLFILDVYGCLACIDRVAVSGSVDREAARHVVDV
jgi:hypothetical protein